MVEEEQREEREWKKERIDNIVVLGRGKNESFGGKAEY